mmetsp:Transcript_13618/g.36831  ORF Transcript_13618/g.36831 Transcript_13618/m.36831 type:complete len:271 (-) Transcript_13618:557-1369(-)
MHVAMLGSPVHIAKLGSPMHAARHGSRVHAARRGLACFPICRGLLLCVHARRCVHAAIQPLHCSIHRQAAQVGEHCLSDWPRETHTHVHEPHADGEEGPQGHHPARAHVLHGGYHHHLKYHLQSASEQQLICARNGYHPATHQCPIGHACAGNGCKDDLRVGTVWADGHRPQGVPQKHDAPCAELQERGHPRAESHAQRPHAHDQQAQPAPGPGQRGNLRVCPCTVVCLFFGRLCIKDSDHRCEHAAPCQWGSHGEGKSRSNCGRRSSRG